MTDKDDNVWENIYNSGGMLNKYPWDAVVTFLMQYAPRDRPRHEIGVVEIGCGTAPNLWFAAREGFRVAGIDISQSAIEFAQKRFQVDGLEGNLKVGDFTRLPFDSDSFLIAIDRAALCCAGKEDVRKCITEIERILQPGGVFYCNVYAQDHDSAKSGKAGPDGRIYDISSGTLTGVGGLRFYDEETLLSLFPATVWKVENLTSAALNERIGDSGFGHHTEWRLVIRKLEHAQSA